MTFGTSGIWILCVINLISLFFDYLLTVWTSEIFEKADYLKFCFHIFWIYEGDNKYSISSYCVDMVSENDGKR